MALQSKDYSVSRKSSSGITYTFILRVTENSVSKESNSSNVTVQAILVSSDDGLAFYNVGIGIDCFLNEQRVIHNNVWRRCEGTGEHIYETWTGDISHDEDGALTLTVGGQLWSTGTANFLPPVLSIEESEAEAMVLTQIVSNTPPATPEGLTAPALVAAGADFEIKWDEAADAEGNVTQYELEKSLNAGESYVPFYSGSSARIFDEAPVEENVVIHYRVRAVDSAGAVSEWSALISVAVNAAPDFFEAAVEVFTDEACNISVKSFSLGQTLYLKASGWIDPDENIAGGQLLLQQRVRTPGGIEGSWEDLLIIDLEDQTEITCEVKPEKAVYKGSVQYRFTVSDALGATCPEWIESAWIIRNDTPQAMVQKQWHRPTMAGAYVMPYVCVNGRWVRYGGEYQNGGDLPVVVTDPAETSILGAGVMGVMILGNEG